jgi:RNA polymerase-binding transcription factor DksA
MTERTREDMLRPLSGDRSLGKVLDAVEDTHRKMLDRLTKAKTYDHKYEPGAYGVCRRCGDERH